MPLVLLVVGAVAVCVLAFWSRGVRAATTWHVSPAGGGACTLADPNCPTIQAAVNAASNGDTIQLAAGTYRENVRINYGNTVADPLTIQGAGAATTIVDGTRSGAVFAIGCCHVNFSGMTITRGKKAPNLDAFGGIYGGLVTVTNCIIADNDAGVVPDTNVARNSIVDTLITNNSGYGARSSNVVRSTITNNVGGILTGIVGPGGTVSIVDSNVSNNSGAGITIETDVGTANISNTTSSQNMGSGIQILTGTASTSSPDLVVNITNSTISNNTSQRFGGGILNFGEPFQGGFFLPKVNVLDSTISGNTAHGLSGDPICTGAACKFFGGGIYNSSVGLPGGFILKNTIVAGNTAASGPDFAGPFISNGHNLFGKIDGSSGLSGGTPGDKWGTIESPAEARLSQLGDHGGPGPTQLLRCGSPALDAGESFGTPTTDQRGMPRPWGAVDIGAVEMGNVTFNFNDSFSPSLRELIQNAPDGAVIDLDPCTTGTVNLTSGELLINKNLTLNGNSSGTLTVQRSPAQGTPDFRVFEIAAGKKVNLSEMTVKNGKTSAQGGGILNHGTLTVSGLFLNANVADGGGGGVANPDGTLNILYSAITFNTAGFGGAVFNGASDNSLGTATTTIRNSLLGDNAAVLGGGIYNNGTEVTIVNSTLNRNSTPSNKGGGIYNNNGTLNFIRSLASNNTSSSSGGGIRNTVSGIANIVNSTFNNNQCGTSNNGGFGGAILNAGSMNLTNVTISGNGAQDSGGGISNESTGTCSLKNTIVAQNGAIFHSPDLHGQFISLGYNLIGKADGSVGFTNGVNGDIVGGSAPIDPMLLPLGDYGGPTQTMAPRQGSSAIDAGDNSVLQPPLAERFDQRGYLRPQTGVLVAPGCNCVDIGAVEFTPIIDARDGVIHFTEDFYYANEYAGSVLITVKREGQTTLPATVDYATEDAGASSCCDYEAQSGTLHFAAGQDTATIRILINNDSFVEGRERVSINLSNPTGGAVLEGHSTAFLEIVDDDTGGTSNQIDDQTFFVTQHYHDFLSREPDSSGLAFWVGTITSCGANAPCIEVKRINASAAFFLSIEFQQTGYFVYRTYKASFGDDNTPGSVPIPVHIDTFMRDTRSIGDGVIVGQGNWQAQLEANKSAFILSFVQSSAFLTRYPSGTTATNFVNALDANAGNPLTSQQKNDLILELAPNPNDPALRADVLRKVVDNSVFVRSEFNRAFVAAEYFGYLRRDPDASGFAFWLAKLNSFNGDYIQAEMVKAFITSTEYRHRFGP